MGNSGSLKNRTLSHLVVKTSYCTVVHSNEAISLIIDIEFIELVNESTNQLDKL